jgi:phytoene dehydrogenase-like protein
VSDVVVVGAGIAGLVCAGDLLGAGIDVVIVEASDGIGGRVRTDAVDGYLLDRGFQIVLTAYPEVHRRLNLDALGLGYFEPGATIWRNGRFSRVADPLRRPGRLLQSAVAPVGTVADKVRLARLMLDLRRTSVPDLLRRPDTSTADRLGALGFSHTMVTALWQPLFAGIGLDPDLEVSSRRFETILKMLAIGRTGVPRSGIGAVPAQLAADIPPERIRCDAPVIEVRSDGVTLATGERVRARAVVVATDGPTAHRLLPSALVDPGSRSVACCWFSVSEPPIREPVLVLDGDESGPVKNLAVLSEVNRAYAPKGRSLVAAAVPGVDALDPAITDRSIAQLARWFGSTTREWVHLRTDVIPHGQPLQGAPFSPKRRVELGGGVFVCGDHRDTASVQGAMFSGERTAQAVLEFLRR